VADGLKERTDVEPLQGLAHRRLSKDIIEGVEEWTGSEDVFLDNGDASDREEVSDLRKFFSRELGSPIKPYRASANGPTRQMRNMHANNEWNVECAVARSSREKFQTSRDRQKTRWLCLGIQMTISFPIQVRRNASVSNIPTSMRMPRAIIVDHPLI
jgi:hypothetical protein